TDGGFLLSSPPVARRTCLFSSLSEWKNLLFSRLESWFNRVLCVVVQPKFRNPELDVPLRIQFQVYPKPFIVNLKQERIPTMQWIQHSLSLIQPPTFRLPVESHPLCHRSSNSVK